MGVSESGDVCFLLNSRAAMRPVPRLRGYPFSLSPVLTVRAKMVAYAFSQGGSNDYEENLSTVREEAETQNRISGPYGHPRRQEAPGPPQAGRPNQAYRVIDRDSAER